MDLTNLQTLAGRISFMSSAIRAYAVEQVRVTKAQETRALAQEARLKTLEATVAQLQPGGGGVSPVDVPVFDGAPSVLTLNRVGNQMKRVTDALRKGV